jgi:hypothetical protein
MRERRDAAAGTNNGQARATTWCQSWWRNPNQLLHITLKC